MPCKPSRYVRGDWCCLCTVVGLPSTFRRKEGCHHVLLGFQVLKSLPRTSIVLGRRLEVRSTVVAILFVPGSLLRSEKRARGR